MRQVPIHRPHPAALGVGLDDALAVGGWLRRSGDRPAPVASHRRDLEARRHEAGWRTVHLDGHNLTGQQEGCWIWVPAEPASRAGARSVAQHSEIGTLSAVARLDPAS